MPKFGEYALSALPFIGGLASAAIQRRWAKKDLEEQNKYNSPVNQLGLLKQAGLPATSYFAGGSSAQSEQPRDTKVDTGAGEYFNKMAVNAFQKKQMQVMDAEAREKNANADMTEAQRNYMLGGLPGRLGQIAGTPLITKLGSEIESTVIGTKQKQLALDISKEFDRNMTEQEFRNKITTNQSLRTQMERVQQEIRQRAEMFPQELAAAKEKVTQLKAQITQIRAQTAETNVDIGQKKQINPIHTQEAIGRVNKLNAEMAKLGIEISIAEEGLNWETAMMKQWREEGGGISLSDLVIQRLLYGGRNIFK